MGPNIGSLLLSICFLVTAGMCLLTRHILKRLGYVALLAIAYAGLCVFLLAHVYPNIYTLLPAYMLLGVTLGPAWISKWNLVVFFASRISCGQQECSSNTADGVEEHKAYCNRDERVRRLARWYHAAENMGIVIGALVASLVMTTCVNHDCSWFYAKSIMGSVVTDAKILNGSSLNLTSKDHIITTLFELPFTVSTSESSQTALYEQQTAPTGQPLDQLINTMFNTNGHGERICGADACPVSMLNYAVELWNDSRTNSQLESHPGSTPLVLAYLAIGLIALLLTVMQQPIDNSFREDKARGLTDTLLFAGPLAYFIGTEQGYVLGDFTKVIDYNKISHHISLSLMYFSGLRILLAGPSNRCWRPNRTRPNAIDRWLHTQHVTSTHQALCCSGGWLLFSLLPTTGPLMLETIHR